MSELINTLIQDARVWQGQRHIKSTQPAEPTGYQALDNQLGGIGWPRGALSECLLDAPGIGELTLLMPLMQRLSQAGKTVFWLNPPHTPYAPALARGDIDLNQVIMVHTEDKGDFLWTLENCLRSPVTGLVMAWPGKLAAREIRRLQLAAEAGSNVCVLFRERRYAEQNSPAALRLELEPGEQQSLNINVLKRRGSWPGQHCSLAITHRANLLHHEAPRVVQGPWPTLAR
ncbi:MULTISPECIES: translesion DNA synthesis-associated protein ImuA [unclassified Marinobacter]|uniref:translesion DNA synthesis-associated protein ImuA n=1 Tax=unclassified Marinobacter TaxID=83889 RepID=UPI0026E26D3D|nr:MULTISPECIES: translesion DNA synthesis-associated protein ImuA [unclassified Marinobacter]MDO6441985.1 translesion DNA synthesis-associated protein ImuA [Marinobacter sp. 2_MG-2023]MDO6825539.1 translesion DNA synthesis-associated protein ImuA [Marinobacter sp. 1_MG-2023]